MCMQVMNKGNDVQIGEPAYTVQIKLCIFSAAHYKLELQYMFLDKARHKVQEQC